MKECIKCGYQLEQNKEKFQEILCDICYAFAPSSEGLFKQYIQDKTNWKLLETFRKHSELRGETQKKGMIKKAIDGNLMSRAPFGYNIENKKLIPAGNSKEVEDIFEEFLNSGISLTQLSKKHGLSVNGLKKILTNFTYLGKIKFNNQTHEGTHKPLVSSILFNHVQDKLEKLGIKIV